MRLREGDSEVEVSGSPIFIRQTLDDLPALLSRLRGEPAPKPSAIRMPAPPPAELDSRAQGRSATSEPVVDSTSVVSGNGHARDDVEAQVLDILRGESSGLAVAAIRTKLGAGVTGQQVRRVLERAGTRVAVSGERPAIYRLR